jgi:hypothetical protein
VTAATSTLEGDAQRFGVPVTRVEYPAGVAGVHLSLTEMARRIYEGMRAPSMQQFAEMVVRNWASIPASRHLSNRESAQIFLDYVRAQVRYRPDPPNTELTKSAAITLCVPGAAMCVPVEDCDGLAVAFLTLCGAFGIPIKILKQTYGGEDQEHVLGMIQTDGGEWLAADPSASDKPLGWKAHASHEDVIDPSDPASIGLVGAPEAEFVGVGKVAFLRAPRRARTLAGLVSVGLGSPVGVGAGFVTPGDVLSYRALWDDYVMGTARAAANCAAAWRAAAAGQTPVTPPAVSNFAAQPDQRTLELWANTEQQYSDDIVTAWNAHANKQDWEIVAMAAEILQDFQSLVRRVGDFYQPIIAHDCPALPLPAPPSLELQKRVIGQIEGLGILSHGVLQLFGIGVGGALQTYQDIAHAAAQPALAGAAGVAVGAVGALVGLWVLSRYLPPPRVARLSR